MIFFNSLPVPESSKVIPAHPCRRKPAKSCHPGVPPPPQTAITDRTIPIMTMTKIDSVSSCTTFIHHHHYLHNLRHHQQHDCCCVPKLPQMLAGTLLSAYNTQKNAAARKQSEKMWRWWSWWWCWWWWLWWGCFDWLMQQWPTIMNNVEMVIPDRTYYWKI